ncbi:hypothetical protein ACH4MA_13985 [Streptomyces roseolus]|uniref:hypothetical protein n=1 Tax=Streptomyces roseolus TaxID=67358 RepID=UPI0037B39AC6
MEEAGDDVQRRLDMLVECLVLFHAHRRDLAFIAYSEIRSLTGEARGTSIGARDRRQRLGAAARGGGGLGRREGPRRAVNALMSPRGPFFAHSCRRPLRTADRRPSRGR